MVSTIENCAEKDDRTVLAVKCRELLSCVGGEEVVESGVAGMLGVVHGDPYLWHDL